ncbi:hypothetical protein J5868_00445 [Candidatus Saccharibacteria bacterium]|nr:hypothetical protein [Candidatus Saccharibacteria bacterium]
MNVFATASDYFYDSVSVPLDGITGATAYMYLRTIGGGTFYTRQGDFSINETNDGNGYIVLQSLTAAGGSGQTTVADFSSDGFKRLMYTDSSFVGSEAGPSDPVMIAVYSVDKDTPAGDYTVSISNALMVGGTSGFDGEHLPTMNATIHVTRTDTPAVKPNQVVTFRDSENNPITEITKHYGDADFTITKSVTTGDGAISEYHPDDDGSGTVAHTIPDSDTVGVGEPGDVEICAWVAETEDYAATRSCYTVHVLKRPLDITGATIADKTYDGTSTAIVTGVTFEDRALSNEEYTATASFDDENAGENKDVHVSVNLAGSAANHYVLNASNYNTTKTISPYTLDREHMSIVGGSTKSFAPGGVEPEVIVTANIHGGLSTLVPGTDYELEYHNNDRVGAATISVTGKGNFTAGADPIMLEFNIEPRGFNTGNMTAPSSIVEDHILAPNEISLSVDGTTLVRCADDGDPDCDYILEISGNDGVVGHTVHVVANGRNNYTGMAMKDINVVAKLPQTVTIGDVTGTTINKTYGDVNFTYSATSDGDGAISYVSSNTAVAAVDPASGAVTIQGVGEADITATAAETATYAEGSASYHLVVVKKTILISSVTVVNKVYDGTTNATVTNAVLSDDDLLVDDGFSISAAHFTSANAGSYTDVYVQITLDDDAYLYYQFAGGLKVAETTGSAVISPFTLGADNATAVLSATEFSYTGEAKEPSVTVTVDLDGNSSKETTLVFNTDYTISYDNNVNAGPATATITGTGNYTASLPALAFSINPAVITDVVATAPAQTYTGGALEPVITVTGTVNGSSMTFTTDDYMVGDHEAFINAGDHTFTVGSKEGTNYNIPVTSGTFTINKAASSEPSEMTSSLSAEVGKTLADLGTLSEGFAWTDPTALITAGMNNYPATYTKNGDATNYTTIDVSVPVLGYTEQYDVAKGDGQEHIIGEDGAVEFEINAEYDLFETGGSVYVDSELVDDADYDSRSGSTIISLKKEYVDSLGLGEHKVSVLFNNGGVAKTKFVNINPSHNEPAAADTGVFTGVTGGAVATGLVAVVICPLISFAYVAIKRNK